MSAHTYRTIQYSPSRTDEIRVNVGVLVRDQAGSQWLSLLAPDDIEHRCKVVAGTAPRRDNSILSDLRTFTRQLEKLDGHGGPNFTAHALLPPLFANPERYNNQIRVSEPSAVVYGGLQETADFLLSALAPLEARERQTRVLTKVRREYQRLISGRQGLSERTLNRPVLDVGSQQSTFEFAFTRQTPRMLVQAFNFDRKTGIDTLQGQINTMNFLVHKARSGRASIRPKSAKERPTSIPSTVAVDVIYHRPAAANAQARNLLSSMLDEWGELDIRPVPDDEVEASVNLASELVLA